VKVGDGGNQTKEVRVGEVRVQLDRGKLENVRLSEKVPEGVANEVVKTKQVSQVLVQTKRQPSIEKLLRMYRSKEDDL